MSVASEVRAEIARQGTNASALAEAAGLRRNTLYARLNERSEFTLPELRAVGAVLGVEPWEFMRRAAQPDRIAA